MENEVTIYYENSDAQPVMLSDCSTIEIKRDAIIVKGRGFTKIFFKDSVKQISTDIG